MASNDRLTLSAVLRSPVAPDEVLAQLRRLPLGASARLDQPDHSTLLVTSGSRFKYRLLGASVGGEQLPLKLRFELAPQASGTSVQLTLTSDEGWYLVYTSRGREAYQARFEQLVAEMATQGIVEQA